MSSRPVADVVRRAADTASRLGFANSSRPEVGQLLAVLAAAAEGPVGELGTGTGHGTAWLLSGLSPQNTITTVELDAERAEVARAVLDDPRVNVLTGDVTAIEPYAPFALLFVDAPVKRDGPDAVHHLLHRPGRAGRLHAIERLATQVRGTGRPAAHGLADGRTVRVPRGGGG